MTKAERSRNLRWRKPALAELGYYAIVSTLDTIRDECAEIHWAFDDDETLINALDGNEEEAWEFRMAFSSLEAEADQLADQIHDAFRFEDDAEKTFDDFSVALIGNRFNQIGFDDYEEDYFALTSYDQELATTEAGKRVMRCTKIEMLSKIGQTIGIIISFQNVRLKYEYLKATIDIFKDQNVSMLQQIKDIERAYDSACESGFYGNEARNFDKLISELPDKLWIE